MKIKNVSGLLVGALSLFLLSACQKKEDGNGHDIVLQWELLQNKFSGEYPSQSLLTIKNKSDEVLQNGGWQLFFNNKPCTLIEEGTTAEGIKVEHINGDYFKLSPTKQMKPLKKGECLTVILNSKARMIKKTDMPVGFYFIFNTIDQERAYVPEVDYVAIPESQMMLSADDIFEIETAASRYERNGSIEKVVLTPEQWVLPSPQFIESGEGLFSLTDLKSIRGESALVNIVKGNLDSKLSMPLVRVQQEASILVSLDTLDFSSSLEAYTLQIKESGVEIKANSEGGVYYAVQSLMQLFPITSTLNSLPFITIKDTPRYEYRGLMLDLARNFQTKQSLLKILDVMGAYKMNKLHLHFSDDEGWRIEIPTLPELTEIGAKRRHNGVGGLLPSYGSGPLGIENVSDGYYSKTDFLEILKFAAQRNIAVIPEVEFPGHARAAIKAMEHRAEAWREKGEHEAANQFLLHDPNDSSQYYSVQNFTDNTICPCQEGTYNFLSEIVMQFKLMYKEAGLELSTIHLGADEVAIGAWEGAPTCQKMFDGSIPEKVKEYYLSRLSSIAAKQGVSLAFWDDIAGHHTDDFKWASDSLTIFSWNNDWGSGNEDRAYRAANGGYKTVLVPVSNMYFDQAYAKNSDEPGFYWGSYTDTYAAFSFLPDHMFMMEQPTKRGQILSSSYLDSKEKLSSEGRKQIQGIEGSLFSETVKSAEGLHYLLFPKMLGLAERAWFPSFIDDVDTRVTVQEKLSQKWEVFASVLGQRELSRLSKRGVLYRVPPVGVKIIEDSVHCNTTFPGMAIGIQNVSKEFVPYVNPLGKENVAFAYTIDANGRRSKPSATK